MSDLKTLHKDLDDMVKKVDGAGLSGEERLGLDAAVTALRHEVDRAMAQRRTANESDEDEGGARRSGGAQKSQSK